MTEQYSERLVEGSDPSERPLRELLVELWENTEKLVRQEVELATAELDSKLGAAKADLLKAGIGVAILYAGLLAIVAALILFVAKFVAPWVAALLVGAVVFGIGYALMQKGKGLNAKKLAPKRTVESLRQDVRTFREAVK